MPRCRPFDLCSQCAEEERGGTRRDMQDRSTLTLKQGIEATTRESSLQTKVFLNPDFNLVSFRSRLAYFQELDPPFHRFGVRRSGHFLWYSE